jgi:DNA-binding MarR family transcriptional regulator
MTLTDLPCACASLRRAARAATQLYDDALRPTGVRLTQFTLLQMLSLTGPITQGSLGEQLAMDSTTLSRTLQPVQKAGWIRSRPGTDRRQRYVEVTKAGLKMLHRATPAWEAAQHDLRHRIGEETWTALGPILTTTTRAARLST